MVDVFKGMGSGFSVAGIIHAGAVQPGDRLLVMPQGEMLTVKGEEEGILACPLQSLYTVKKVTRLFLCFVFLLFGSFSSFSSPNTLFQSKGTTTTRINIP